MRGVLILCVLLMGLVSVLKAQVVINEVSNRSLDIYPDEDMDAEDWFELYNAGPDTVNLEEYGITDRYDEPHQWMFPDYPLAPGEFLTVFASGKDRKPNDSTDHYESITGDHNEWKFTIPNASTGEEWRDIDYLATGWYSGKASIGYGDGDDSVEVPEGTISIFLRYSFTIEDTSRVSDALIALDFDDGFAAYLNGELIAQYGFPGGYPSYDALAPGNHEAVMYTGGLPEVETIDEAWLKTLLVEGENVLAVEVHNVSPTSSDMTCKPYFFMGFKDTITTFEELPAWIDLSGGLNFLHTNFKLSGEGETLYLFSPAGLPLDSVYTEWMDVNHSYGRKNDGDATWAYFGEPTPAASNNPANAFSGYMAEPVIETEAGFYSDMVTTTITCPDPVYDIYYSLNGQTPTESAFLYDGPIEMTSTTTVRARCISPDPDLLAGKTATKTFFVDFPSDLAVFAISTDDENLYGDDGIIDNWWTDWKRPCHVEFFNEAHEPVANQRSGMKIDGGAGGSRWRPQKSFRIEPGNNAFGDGEMEYPIIPRRQFVESYETFYLRNGSNMYNVLPYKDAYMVRVTEGTYNDHMAYTPVEVWLNGDYYGLYELREKLDEGHYKNAHLVEKDDLDLLSVSYFYDLVLRTLQGSDEEYLQMLDDIFDYPDPDDPGFWDYAHERLDLYWFTDYLIGETWMANFDWPYNNIKVWRERSKDNKWKYAIIDLELGMGYGWSNAYSNLITHLFDNYNLYTSPVLTLIDNEQYRHYFINRYADLMNTTFLPDRMLAMEDSIYQLVEPAMPRQLQKWGEGGTIASQMATFEDYRDALLDDMVIRTDNARDHIEDYFDLNDQVEITLNVEPPGAGRIRISTLKIYDTPWSGVYFDGVPVEVIAEPNTGYTFSYWEENPFIEDALAAGFTVNFDDDTELTAWFTGSPQTPELVVSEINYHPEDSRDDGNWIELLNSGDYTVDLSSWILTDDNPLQTYVLPDGIVLEPGERWVICSDLDLFTAWHPEVENVSGSTWFGFSNDGDMIRLITDRGDTIIDMTYNDAWPWPQGADGEGRTLELLDPLMDPSSPESWFDGCVGGSPGMPYEPCGQPVVISEINYNPADDLDADDWVELRNTGTETIDLSGWQFRNSNASVMEGLIIPAGTTLGPGEHYVLVQTDWKFSGVHPEVDGISPPFFFGLEGDNDWLRLYDTAGVLQLSVHYRDSLPWPLDADGLGYTLELIDSLGIMNNGDNWMTGCYGGSPGTYLQLPCDPANNLEELAVGGIMEVYPNPADSRLFVRCEGWEGNGNWQVLGANGAVLMSGTVSSISFEIDLQELPAGLYLLRYTEGVQQSVRVFTRQ